MKLFGDFRFVGTDSFHLFGMSCSKQMLSNMYCSETLDKLALKEALVKPVREAFI